MDDSELQARDADLYVRFPEPNLIAVTPSFDQRAAIAKAGSRAREYFGGTPDSVELTKALLLPFWRVRCSYRIEYECATAYELIARHPDATDIYLVGKDPTGNVVTLRADVNRQTDRRNAALLGYEHRVTTTNTDLLIQSYKTLLPVSTISKTVTFVRRGADRVFRKPAEDGWELLGRYLEKAYLVVPNDSYPTFFHQASVGELPVFADQQRESIEVLMPTKTLKEVVGAAIRRSVVDVKLTGRAKGELEFSQIDLYYHPAYRFKFNKTVAGDLSERIEQMDAVTGEWYEAQGDTGTNLGVNWDSVLAFTLDTMLEILKTFAPTPVRVFAIATEKGIEHFLRGTS